RSPQVDHFVGSPIPPGDLDGVRLGVVLRGSQVDEDRQIGHPLDHRGRYPPLCSVRFALQELTGRPSRDYVTADLHEDWVEPAHPDSERS
ncbi:MAG: hypothetical protein LBI49_02325, partial [Nocardiopsaceae bacterium]|nr:hypothetical protein [Nocardiopsaceae bacterium]